MIRIIALPRLGLPSYHVVTGERPEDEPALLRTAIRLGDELSRKHYGANGGYVVLFNAGAGRRKPWPHAHVVAVRSVAHKRLVLGLLLLKRWLPSRAVVALDRSAVDGVRARPDHTVALLESRRSP